MTTYEFYYDKSELTRKINYNTISTTNYYDIFVTIVVGWSSKERFLMETLAF